MLLYYKGIFGPIDGNVNGLPHSGVFSGSLLEGREPKRLLVRGKPMNVSKYRPSGRVSTIVSAAITGAVTLLHSGQIAEALLLIATGLLIAVCLDA